MQQQSRSTNLRKRLSGMPVYQPVDGHDDEFVETVRMAVAKLPDSGPGSDSRASKRHRVLYAHDNCARALMGIIDEALENGAGVDDIIRLEAALSRAIRRHLKKRNPALARAACIKVAIGAETAANSLQNEAAHSVLVSGSIGDNEKLWEASRLQRDMSQAVLESCEDRIAQLRAEASAR